MQVAVLGAGGIGRGYIAFLADKGHQTTLWSPSGKSTKAFAEGAPLAASGEVSGNFSPTIATTCQAALENADVVLIAVPGNAHRMVMDQAAPHLHPDQIVIISSHCSLSALYLSKLLAERGVQIPIAAWATTFLAGRSQGETGVGISTIRKTLDVSTLPLADEDRGLEVCQALFGDHFQRRSDLLAISLSNLNPPVHMANSLCNLTRIERAEEWANYELITGTVGRLIEAMDVERLAVAEAYGVTVRTIREHIHLSFHVPLGPVAEMTDAIHARRGGPPGPNSLDTRYVVEDVPFGLVPSVAIGRAAGVAMPLHEAGINLFSALYGRDFPAENDILPELGLERMNGEELPRLVGEGWKAE
ncbi:MAG TPA: NAD/NADP octopine/nopaline dehydrogenase family protein [Rhodospirillales bacterium]|nr:NAD/NADP octopine/nopaline dehydrogenase family protein [Rhodospirillales bacterium]